MSFIEENAIRLARKADIASNKKLFLCRPNKDVICTLNGVDIDTVNYSHNLKDYDTISFTIHRYINVYDSYDGINKLVESNGYEDIGLYLLVYLEDIGYFQIQEPQVSFDGFEETKSIQGYSNEKELENKDLVGFAVNTGEEGSLERLVTSTTSETVYGDGGATQFTLKKAIYKINSITSGGQAITYGYSYSGSTVTFTVAPYSGERIVINYDCLSNLDDLGFAKEYITFYNESKPQLSLMHLVLEKMPGWSIGYIAPSLNGQRFQFDVESENIYAFLTTTVAPYCKCIFTFDTIHNIINAYDVNYFGEDTNVFVGVRNLINSVDVSCNEDSVYTRFNVRGDNDLTVSNVNYGDERIFNLDYFLDTKYMPQSLIDKVNHWVNWRNANRTSFINLAKDIADYQEKISELNYRVPSDENYWKQWDGMNEEGLRESLKMYNAELTVLRVSVDSNPQYDAEGEYIPWKDGSGNVDDDAYLDLLYNATNGYGGYYHYKELITYVIPNIETAISNLNLPDSQKAGYIDVEGAPVVTSESFTGDGSRTSFTVVHTIANLISVTVGGLVIGSDQFDYANNRVNITEAPKAGTSVVIRYSYIMQNWELFGIFELEAELQNQQNIITVVKDYSVHWENLTPEQQAEHTGGADDYNVKHYRYVAAKEAITAINKQLAIEKSQIRKWKDSLRQKQEQREEMVKFATLEGFSYQDGSGNTIRFSSDDIKLIHTLFHDTDYTNANIITTSIDTTLTTIDVQKELFDDATSKLVEVCQPQYSFSISLDNLLRLEAFKDWESDFAIGNFIRVGIRDDYAVKLRIVSMEWNPSDTTPDLSIGFSNMITGASGRDDLSYILGEQNGSGRNQISSGKGNANTSDEYVTALLEKMSKTALFKNSVNGAINASTINADFAHITSIVGDYLNYAHIDVGQIVGESGEFQKLFAKYLGADVIVSKMLTAEEASIWQIYAHSGMIYDTISEDQTVTHNLTAVQINGDLIEATTLRADTLIIRGEDGLYYKLNALGGATQAELATEEYQTQLHGSNIIAHSITANRINVSDLYAFNATIGGTQIEELSLHTVGKNSLASSAPGLYIDRLGQIRIGDELLYSYDSVSGNWNLVLNVDTFSIGGINMDSAIANSLVKVDVEYGLSNSQSVQPSAWYPSVEWTSGMFKWMKTSRYYGTTTASEDPVNPIVEIVCLGGAKGEQGIQGLSSFTHIRYAPVANPTDDQITTVPDKYIGICTDNNQDAPTTARSYTWSKIQGEDGPQGIQGPKGDDGLPTYVHFAYANSADGSVDFSVTSFPGAKYIGVRSDHVPDDSQVYTDYAWSELKGDKGDDGLSPEITSTKNADGSVTIYLNGSPMDTIDAGKDGESPVITTTDNPDGSVTINVDGVPSSTIEAGKDGKNNFTYIRYSANADGSNMTDVPQDNTKYLGIYTGESASVPSYRQFIWSKYIGEDGDSPDPLVVTGVDVDYQLSASGVDIPQGTWSETPLAPTTDFYLWTRTTVHYSAGDPAVSYSIGGKVGQNGANGKSVTQITNYYLADSRSSGVLINDPNWTTTPQTMTEENQYLWNYEVTTDQNGDTISTTNPTIIGRYGQNGEPGKGISSIVEYYAINNDPATIPDDSEFTPATKTPTVSNRFLWNYEVINYTEGDPTITDKKVIGVYGQTGQPGLNNATVNLYQRSASLPSKPNSDLTYTFASGILSGTLGNWSQSVPDGEDPVWMIVATASSAESTDTISPSQWSTPITTMKNGEDAVAYNQATVMLYQRAASAPSKPSSSLIYTFATGALNTLPSGWYRTPPDSDGNPCYMTSAVAIGTEETATIAASAWSEPAAIFEDGDDAYRVDIASSNGLIFKNTNIQTVLTAHVYKGALELTNTTTPTYASVGTLRWYKDDSTTPITSSSSIIIGTDSNGRSTLTITSGGVDNTATFSAKLEVI